MGAKLWAAVYVLAIAVAFVKPLISCVFYRLAAVIWLVPDPRIERTIVSSTARGRGY